MGGGVTFLSCFTSLHYCLAKNNTQVDTFHVKHPCKALISSRPYNGGVELTLLLQLDLIVKVLTEFYSRCNCIMITTYLIPIVYNYKSQEKNILKHVGMESQKSNQTRQKVYRNDYHPYIFRHFPNHVLCRMLAIEMWHLFESGFVDHLNWQ